MARYYYDRYRVSSSTEYNWQAFTAAYVQGSGWGFNNSGIWTDADSSLSGSSSYSFNSSSGYISSGTNYNRKISSMPSTFYQAAGSVVYRWQVTNQGGGDYYVYIQEQHAGYGPGSHVKYVWDAGPSYRTPGIVNSDGYYWDYWTSRNYYRGSYIDTIVAEDGTYPDNDRVGTSYWYIKRNRAFPEMAVKVSGQAKTAIDGWIKVNGQLKRITNIWVKVNGQLKGG